VSTLKTSLSRRMLGKPVHSTCQNRLSSVVPCFPLVEAAYMLKRSVDSEMPESQRSVQFPAHVENRCYNPRRTPDTAFHGIASVELKCLVYPSTLKQGVLFFLRPDKPLYLYIPQRYRHVFFA
jgi:hypothetical protein